MNDSTLALARRAVACPRWRWLPGMLTHEGYRLIRLRKDGLWVCAAHDARGIGRVLGAGALNLRGSFPDLSDPCTLGGLLALVREAWGDPHAYLGWFDPDWKVIHNRRIWGPPAFPGGNPVLLGRLAGRGKTEAEALVAALVRAATPEAAP